MRFRAAESVPTDKVELEGPGKKACEPANREPCGSVRRQKKYRDEYQENVRAMIAAKLKGRKCPKWPAAPAPVIDLMEALKGA